jgi:hypothetical protein
MTAAIAVDQSLFGVNQIAVDVVWRLLLVELMKCNYPILEKIGL